MGSVRMTATGSLLPDLPARRVKSIASVDVLAVRYASMADTTRSAIRIASEQQHETTANILLDILATADKDLWMLEARLQKQDRPAMGKLKSTVTGSHRRPLLLSMKEEIRWGR